ncbi:MAG: hypothetical protein JJ900_07985 [Rhodospirillales bacterium]|nr:hypothetical protein [Rhodospirillales bacterium]MBO6786776.1 hypothetical protein [Rhodospirillales bacterium]
MGWLLTIVLAMPLTTDDVEFRMWFSKESYCTFAIEKFSEKPFMQRLPDGNEAPGMLKSATCRELGKDEKAMVPDHLVWKVNPLGGLFDRN